MTSAAMHVNRSLMLMGCLGPEILVAIWMKGQFCMVFDCDGCVGDSCR